ncbi:DUF4956 domain-containing protein [uncultured Draconibacterium sp.]|uniref:DUF4956 domain-containing protein n=1 Tax=uncultured Draconibacterium sp. TaxID=1573823 RepID=UPI0032164667
MEELQHFSDTMWFDFLLRLAVNIVSTLILIRFVYYPRNSRVKYLFTFFLLGLMIFLIASILDRVSLDIGFAFGLFAIFGIIRYRSPSIDLKEMTYLFLVIGMSIINALVVFNISDWFGLVVANSIILLSAYIMENYVPRKHIIKKALVFSPSNYAVLSSTKDLLDEVRRNTGIDVLKVEISKINKTKNEVAVWIYFIQSNDSNNNELPVEKVKQPENLLWESTSTAEY